MCIEILVPLVPSSTVAKRYKECSGSKGCNPSTAKTTTTPYYFIYISFLAVLGLEAPPHGFTVLGRKSGYRPRGCWVSSTVE